MAGMTSQLEKDIKEFVDQGTDDLTGFTFDLGELSHPIYGTASNLRGELELPIYPLRYQILAPLKNPEILHKIALEMLPHVRDAYPESLDEEIIEKIKGCGMIASLPFLEDPSVPCIKFFILGCVLGWTLDDLIDTGEDQVFTYKSFVEHWRNVDTENIEKNDLWGSIPSVHAQVEAVKKIGRYTTDFYLEHGPAGVQFYVPQIFSVVKKVFQGSIILNELKQSGLPYSRTATFEAYFEAAGNRVSLECNELFVSLEEEIRTDFLFQRVMNCYLEYCNHLNSILGLKKDLLKGEEDSPLFYLCRVEKKNLQEAFDIIYGLLKDSYNDFKVVVPKLKEVYPDNEKLHKYLHVVGNMMTATILGYKLWSRYGVQDCIQYIREVKQS